MLAHALSICAQGPYDDFSVEWYTVPGVAIMFTMAANMIAPHVAPLLKAFVLKPLKIRKNRDKVTTQVRHATVVLGRSASNWVPSVG